jgi:hypothetical protein
VRVVSLNCSRGDVSRCFYGARAAATMETEHVALGAETAVYMLLGWGQQMLSVGLRIARTLQPQAAKILP